MGGVTVTGSGVRTALVNQPALFPWLGEWQKLSTVDVAVCLDSVEVQKAGFLTRARIRGEDATPRWLTVPSRKSSRHGSIAAVQLLPADVWRRRTLDRFHHAYRSAPHRESALQLLECVTAQEHASAVDLAERSVIETARFLELALPQRFRASDLGVTASGSALVARLVATVGAERYVYGPGGRRAEHYLDRDLLRAHGIEPVMIAYADADPLGTPPARLSILHDIAHLGRAASRRVVPLARTVP